jgi:hypothetical protein
MYACTVKHLCILEKRKKNKKQKTIRNIFQMFNKDTWYAERINFEKSRIKYKQQVVVINIYVYIILTINLVSKIQTLFRILLLN